MRFGFGKFGVLLATVVLTAGLSAAESFTGEVSDAMCGAKHEMGGSPTECTHSCVGQGSKYALVVGEKVYTLETGDKAALEKLNGLAGKKATVTGTASGATIQVASVAAGK